MHDILTIIPGKKRKTSSGWYSFNAVCCHNRGHNTDKKGRAGIKFTDEKNYAYSCFNCGFKCGFQLGKHFSSNLKSLLLWCGMDIDEINRLSFESFSQRSITDLYTQHQVIKLPDFKDVELPENARLLDPAVDVEHVEYLTRRGISYDTYPFYVVDDEVRKRIIIPYYYGGRLVGNTSRYYDGRHPKYVSEQQSGYVFNIDAQEDNWDTCIVVEGQFDAISIGGCAIMSNSITDVQANFLKRLHRRIIFVPDRDKTGLSVCDRALELGFNVSIPDWADDVKDVNDAVRKYGRLPTLLSILQNSTTSKIVVEMKRKKLQ